MGSLSSLATVHIPYFVFRIWVVFVISNKNHPNPLIFLTFLIDYNYNNGDILLYVFVDIIFVQMYSAAHVAASILCSCFVQMFSASGRWSYGSYKGKKLQGQSSFFPPPFPWFLYSWYALQQEQYSQHRSWFDEFPKTYYRAPLFLAASSVASVAGGAALFLLLLVAPLLFLLLLVFSYNLSKSRVYYKKGMSFGIGFDGLMTFFLSYDGLMAFYSANM